jgi:hypothetical protein
MLAVRSIFISVRQDERIRLLLSVLPSLQFVRSRISNLQFHVINIRHSTLDL